MHTGLHAATRRDEDCAESDYVHGEIVFARRAPDEAAPAFVLPNHESYAMVKYDVPIRNARPLADKLSLDSEGFILARHQTDYSDVRDLQVMRQQYVDEMVPFIKDFFDASWVVPFRNTVHLRRAAGEAVPRSGWNTAAAGARGPAGFAHVDYAPVVAPVVAARESQNEGVPIRPYSRMVIIQAWRALSPPPQDIPLAFCDANTVGDKDIAIIDYVSNAKDPAGSATKSISFCFDPAQRWYYFPQMTSDELILFKGYDSDTHYRVWAPHSAFDNRRHDHNALPRESIEARFFVYYE
jgi:hypothetical protein